MKINRIVPTPTGLMEFFEQGLSALGAVCSRSWHDRLEVLAEARAARLWNDSGELHETELQFVAPDMPGVRDARREVFPGCPLTFGLANALCPKPPALERVTLANEGSAARPPDAAVAEKLWRTQFPDTTRWRQTAPFTSVIHFSLVAVVRFEIQAIDQQWSLRRMAWSLPDGQPDEMLAHDIGFARTDPTLRVQAWPTIDTALCRRLLTETAEHELSSELATVRARQENQLRHELARIEEYFANYEGELLARVARSGATKVKADERIAAARAECERHRADQVRRHEIAIVPHVDALLLVAESAWHAALQVDRAHQARADLHATFVGRSRRWTMDEGAG